MDGSRTTLRRRVSTSILPERGRKLFRVRKHSWFAESRISTLNNTWLRRIRGRYTAFRFVNRPRRLAWRTWRIANGNLASQKYRVRVRAPISSDVARDHAIWWVLSMNETVGCSVFDKWSKLLLSTGSVNEFSEVSCSFTYRNNDQNMSCFFCGRY